MESQGNEPASVFASYFSAVTSYLFIGAVVIVIVLVVTKRRRASNLDIPGPWSFPVIGCLYLFRWSSSPHKTLSWLTWIYGNVYTINLGGTHVVLVNYTDAVKEVLHHKSRDFAGRPQLFSFSLWGGEDSFMVKDYSSDFLFLKYKAEISLQELLNKEKSIISRSTKAVKSLIDSFTSQNSAFYPDNSIRATVADFIMDCVFGQSISRWFYHEARVILQETSSAYIKTAYVGACTDFLSTMRYLSGRTLRATTSQVVQFRVFVRKVYRLHLASTLCDTDYTESLACILRSHDKGYRLVVEHENNSTKTRLDDAQIVISLCDIMFNAYEKISTCFEWCVARLASNPRLQHVIQLELTDQEFVKNGSSRLLAATINETLRTTCVLPFGFPRRTTRDTFLNGYKIPRNTIVFLNLWSCCNDAQYFTKPNEFNPYRFISNETTHAEKLPSFCCFSGGERKCLGDTFSKMFLITLAGGLLKEFDLELATPSSCKSLEGPYGLTLRPKRYTIYARKRTYVTHSEA